MYMVMLILEDTSRLEEVMAAWKKPGVSGVTILEFYGSYRRLNREHAPTRDDSTGGCSSSNQFDHYTLLSVMEDKQTVECCLSIVEELVGSLDQPDTGVFAAWPLEVTRGIQDLYGRSPCWNDMG